MGEGQAAARACPGAGGGPADHLLHAGDAVQRCSWIQGLGLAAALLLSDVLAQAAGTLHGAAIHMLVHSWQLGLVRNG